MMLQDPRSRAEGGTCRLCDNDDYETTQEIIFPHTRFNVCPECLKLVQQTITPRAAWFRGVCESLASEMRTSGDDRVAEYGWRLTRLLEAYED